MDAALDEITMPTEIVAAIGEGALAYRESGILSLADGRVFSACRQYRYRLSEDSVVVEFADGPHVGTQFLSLSFSRTDTGLEASGVYACGDDTYHATYRILGPAAFEVVIMVQGPAKAYELVSRYSRSGEMLMSGGQVLCCPYHGRERQRRNNLPRAANPKTIVVVIRR